MSALARRAPANLLDRVTATAGDLVRTGDNAHPQFRVIAVADDRAWIRNTQHGTDHVVPLGQCRRIPPVAGLQDL